jgi:predicted kinase
MSDIIIDIVLEEMKDYKLSTAVKYSIYFGAVKIPRGELQKRKKRKVAEVNQEHEKTAPDDNEGKQDKGSTQNKTRPNPRSILASPF